MNLEPGRAQLPGAVTHTGTWRQTSDSTYVEHLDYCSTHAPSQGLDNVITYHFRQDGNLLTIEFRMPGEENMPLEKQYWWRVPQGNSRQANTVWSQFQQQFSREQFANARTVTTLPNGIIEYAYRIDTDSVITINPSELMSANSYKHIPSYTDRTFSAQELQEALTGVWMECLPKKEANGTYTLAPSFSSYKILRADGRFFNLLSVANIITVSGTWEAMKNNKYIELIKYHHIHKQTIGMSNSISVRWASPDIFIMKNNMENGFDIEQAWMRVTGLEADEVLKHVAEWEQKVR